MKTKILVMWVVMVFSAIVFAMGCGGGGGADNGIVTGTGSNLNSDWVLDAANCGGTITGGTFTDGSGYGASVIIADGEMSACVNATEPPTITAVSELPDGFDINISEGDENVTVGGAGYAFDINGDRGFITNTEAAVTITLPFDTAQVLAENRTSIKVFVRIFTNDDNSLSESMGVIAGNLITVETRGLPKQFTAAVIYNQYMDYVVSDEAVVPAVNSILKNVTETPPWLGRQWLVEFNAASAPLITAVQNVLALGATVPTAQQIRDVITSNVAEVARSTQEIYENVDLRAPNLSTTNYIIGLNPTRWSGNYYTIHIIEAGSNFTPQDPAEVVSPDGNFYGRLYINAERIDDDDTNALGTITASIAHETLHAIQDGYELIVNTVLRGVDEGTATIYGFTIDHGGDITARSSGATEIFMLSNFLLSTGLAANRFPQAYANQDFFAYVGAKYNGGELDYIPEMLEKIRTDIESESSVQLRSFYSMILSFGSIRSTMYGAIDSYFQSRFQRTLREIYLDFLRQRTFEHNAESRFGRVDETVDGFAENLYAHGAAGAADNGIMDVTVNADDCTMTNEWGLFSSVAPFAARAVRITTSNASTAAIGPTIGVTIATGSGTIGDDWAGFAYRSGSTTDISVDGNEFTNFGKSVNDSVVFTIANISENTDNILSALLSSLISYRVTCEANSGGGGGGPDTFALTSFTLPGLVFSPSYIWPASSANNISFILTEEDATDPNFLVTQYLLIQLNGSNISGPGSYDVTSCYADESSRVASALFSKLSTLTAYCSTAGTVNLTSFDTASGGRVTGSMNATLEDIMSISSGEIDLTFDFTVP